MWFKSDISGTEDIGNIQEIYRNIQEYTGNIYTVVVCF